jgi:ribulose-5-phosphate 4-epimerase/fuculose-1-phosphate aldolase
MADDDRKHQLVAALQMLESAEIIDFNGHASVRTGEDRFLINSGASVRSRLTVEDIIEIGHDGRLLAGSTAPPMEFPLHAEIYRLRTDVSAIVHAHPKWSTFLSMTGRAYEPVFPQGALLGRPPVFDDVLSVNTRERGEKLARTIGSAQAALLKSHGTIVVGSDMTQCFALTVYLEENAYRQFMAAQIGTAYILGEDEVRASIETLWKQNLFRKTWDYYFAKAGLA